LFGSQTVGVGIVLALHRPVSRRVSKYPNSRINSEVKWNAYIESSSEISWLRETGKVASPRTCSTAFIP